MKEFEFLIVLQRRLNLKKGGPVKYTKDQKHIIYSRIQLTLKAQYAHHAMEKARKILGKSWHIIDWKMK